MGIEQLIKQATQNGVIIKARNLWKVYDGSDIETIALKKVDLDVLKGTFSIYIDNVHACVQKCHRVRAKNTQTRKTRVSLPTAETNHIIGVANLIEYINVLFFKLINLIFDSSW